MKKYIRDVAIGMTTTTGKNETKIVRNRKKRSNIHISKPSNSDGAGLLALVDAASKRIKRTSAAKPILKKSSKNSVNLKWTAAEDNMLAALVKKYKCKRWKEVAVHFPNRSATQCSQHWRKCADPDLKKNQKWTPEEDAILLSSRKQNPPLTFGEIANKIQGRTNIQCRNRWDNVVNPKIRRGPFSKTEDEVLLGLRKQGLRWVDMPEHRALQNRSSVSLKNRYRRLKSLNGIQDSNGKK